MSKEQSGLIVVSNVICREQQPDSYPQRFWVPEGLISWETPFSDYDPVLHDAPRAGTPKKKEGDYEDPANPTDVDWSRRSSLVGEFRFDDEGYPLNPLGRTGIKGRGILNAWGPTKAVDAIITRDGIVGEDNPEGLPEVLAIIRADNGKPANVAGKLEVNKQNEPWEGIFDAASRETFEEAGIHLDFAGSRVTYSGYVDDERNSDHAWMETVGLHIHLDREESEKLELKAQEPDVKNPAFRVAEPSFVDSFNALGGPLTKEAVSSL